MPARPAPWSQPFGRVVLGALAAAAVALAFADIEIAAVDPWAEMARLAGGLFPPDFFGTEDLLGAVALTAAFALLGVAAANAAGFGLALVFHLRAVRVFAAVIRAVHELFWALIFLQLFGLSPLTGLLAIAIPYAGVFAKVYAEILEEQDPGPMRAAPAGAGRVSLFLFVRLPEAWPHFKTYSLYRLECALRSSAILGFLGLPTLGFHLETAFGEGEYAQVWALLIVFYLLIASIRVWARGWLIPGYLVAAALILPWDRTAIGTNAWRFLTHDIVPYPLRAGEGLDAFGGWLGMMVRDQVLPGAVASLQLSVIALVLTGLLAFLWFPLVSPLFFGRLGRGVGHVFLVLIRSTPEYVLAYVLLQLWGPSMLPAILALSLHNGAIIGHLMGRFTTGMRLRPDAPHGMDRYFWEAAPRVYRQAMAFLLYRWEVIMRETAILGFLGVGTLGFYVDSAFAEIRYDRALLLIAATAVLNIGLDATSRRLRRYLRLTTRIAVQ
ncbi:MAG: ABC transporter permease [Alphaproteobacteria bacterium]|nr:ABC transporter permease [Alphaproteobacteria bacterium]MCB9931781.1 ABC transporter permease [Alphaproteobacteria bacterium]